MLLADHFDEKVDLWEEVDDTWDYHEDLERVAEEDPVRDSPIGVGEARSAETREKAGSPWYMQLPEGKSTGTIVDKKPFFQVSYPP